MLKVTLKRSTIKATEGQLASVRGLGLKKINSTRIVQDTPAIRGMLVKVRHLVHVEEVAD
jgi:large subunit ribosomal protein L30